MSKIYNRGKNSLQYLAKVPEIIKDRWYTNSELGNWYASVFFDNTWLNSTDKLPVNS